MTLDDLKRIALSTRSQSFVSIEAWELLALIEIAEAASRIENHVGFCRRPLSEYCAFCEMKEALSKLTSGGEGT
jgi:hypothetical protein